MLTFDDNALIGYLFRIINFIPCCHLAFYIAFLHIEPFRSAVPSRDLIVVHLLDVLHYTECCS